MAREVVKSTRWTAEEWAVVVVAARGAGVSPVAWVRGAALALAGPLVVDQAAVLAAVGPAAPEGKGRRPGESAGSAVPGPPAGDGGGAPGPGAPLPTFGRRVRRELAARWGARADLGAVARREVLAGLWLLDGEVCVDASAPCGAGQVVSAAAAG